LRWGKMSYFNYFCCCFDASSFSTVKPSELTIYI